LKPANVLLLPGWRDTAPALGQSQWPTQHGYTRVEQHDWQRPLRGDWISRLEDVLLSCDEPAVLVGDGLGCLLVAAWAAHSGHTARVKAALLVAPIDVQREALRPLLHSWSPLPLGRLPFTSVLLASRDDPSCAFDRAQALAAAWGARWVEQGHSGHIYDDSELQRTPDGHSLLQELMQLPGK
jgi:uncharacterized protein